VTTPRVPVQIPARSTRVQAALRFAAGPTPGGTLSAGLCFLCEQLAAMTDAPIASAYVLEAGDELVLRGPFGYGREVIGEVRLKVGQGITGTCVETMRPVTVDDARVSAQFEYFPQLAEERFPAFLAVPLLSGGRPRGALVLQREAGPFSEEDMVLAAGATRALTALIEAQHNLDRYEKLSRSGFISDQTLESQRVTVTADQQAVEAAHAQYDLAVANEKWGGSAQRGGVESAQIQAAHSAVLAANRAVSQIQLEIEKAILTAPVDGVVSAINGNIGEYPSGRQLFTIHDDSSMYAMLTASSSQVEHLHAGEAVSVATSDGVMHANGVVDSVLDQLTPGTTNFIVKVRIPNAAHQWRAGVPVTVKVNIDQQGFATTNGLKLQRDVMARSNSPVIDNLRKAGAVILGRTNCPAFSYRWFTTNLLHGDTKNPRDPGITPGGSSGGACPAVASMVGTASATTAVTRIAPAIRPRRHVLRTNYPASGEAAR